MEKNFNQDLYAEAIKKALKVDFISNNEELKLYAVSLYNAMIWARRVDIVNRRIKQRGKSLK